MVPLDFFLLQGTEELLKKESGISDADVKQETTAKSESEVSHALAAYKRFVTSQHRFSRPRGRGFEPHRRHCAVSFEQDTFILA